jgi:serpin B
MGQVYAGAGGDAKTAIASTMGWSLPDAEFHEAFDAAELSVSSHHDPSGDPPLQITSTNQIFVTTGYPLGQAWLDTLSEWYGTGAQQMDFEKDPKGVASDINDWIADRTGDHIKDLIDAELVANSRMLLVNAVYFQASWEVPFSESSTKDQDFTTVDGSKLSVPMMTGAVNVRGIAGDGFFVADLPYSDDGLTMTLVLPDEGRFSEVLSTLDWGTLSTLLAAEESCKECSFTMPRFEVKSAPDMTGILKTMGMDAAFGGAYPGINDALTLTSVGQQGFVSVNEKGTEAAAATVAAFADSYSEPPFGPVVVDRPFMWMVREQDGAILFAGVVTDPR